MIKEVFHQILVTVSFRILLAVHDESLRYLLSDNAVAALADKFPTTLREIYDAISQADLNNDSLNLNSSLQSPSPVVCSHLEDIYYLFEKMGKANDIFQLILQRHLGPNGSCTLSIYNYALLSKSNLKLENRIYANDGRLLCYCNRRKLEWYLRRDLAKLVDDNPPAIMLLFEPKGRPEDEDNDFYIQKHFKSHRSHDIVLLCVDCHEIAHAAAEKYKKQIAAEFGIPLFIRIVIDSKQAHDICGSSASIVNLEEAGVTPLELRTAAMALLRHGSRMPSKRREELMQIVMRYYGGQEISEEDLERALLVGMSPHERRRFEKKRGLSFKHATGSIISDKKLDFNSGKVVTATAINTSSIDNVNSSQATQGETCSKEEDCDLSMVTDMDVSSNSFCSDLEVNGKVFAATSKGMNSDRSRLSEAKGISDLDIVANSESRSESNGTTNSFHPRFDGTVSPKHNSKLSLLGHGPHWKQVVDHLLKEYGEDGIRQFCQRWRQVFVEAIHPRFLPAGWDVMHSGRRDFGEFSVHNPTKKASAVAKRKYLRLPSSIGCLKRKSAYLREGAENYGWVTGKVFLTVKVVALYALAALIKLGTEDTDMERF
ncbi:hypothetical protein F0562_008287 [Nyssa sinensis]|uniref:HRDC domain-containing protein n=1 Tax=Nyssa sinensis TaxID=561372 RepID=A0A5J5A7N4_9ASTE|nr:hypothetical protein F0562_008287 [Nyssa sinensis]